MSDQAPRIAIVGMAGRYPGARDTAQLWANLLAGRESITRFTADEMRPNEPDIDALMQRDDFVAARGVLDDTDLFDADFFGFSPREATLMDPQHRLMLEACWAALEQAGVDPARFDGPIGLYAGTGYMEQYLLNNLLHTRQQVHDLAKLRATDSFATKIFNDSDYMPGRVAFKLNLRGPVVNVQTACSTSLVAVHMACQSLLAFECDLALAGGVAIDTPQQRGFLAQEGGMFSQDGHCRTFDADACGTVFSSGLGVFVLKRLDEAVDDGDDILAVIRGSAINNDGSNKASYVAPSPDGQAEVIALAQAVADVHPDDIGYIEAHGTATPLGDPIEIDGLTRAWRRKSTATGQVRIGSIKSNIGHTDAAAGAAGLTKLVYAVREGELPASLHYRQPNPGIDFAQSPFTVQAERSPWPQGRDAPRIAGISSFGVGGTNAHLIVEQPPERAAGAPAARSAQLLLVSARAPEALAQRCTELADWLEAHPDTPLHTVAWTLATGRQAMPLRRAVVARTHTDAAEALRAVAGRPSPGEALHAPSLAFLFPGQGAQHPGMGQALYDSERVYRDTVDRLAGHLEPELGLDIRSVLYPDAQDSEAADTLRHTGMAQPALFVSQLALARLLASWGLAPAADRPAMLGHSVGEYVAACLAGVFTEQQACGVLAARARLMAEQPGGSMLAVRKSEDALADLLTGDVELAAVNAPNLCVLSGPDDAIDAVQAQLTEAGEEPIRLHTSHAFHSAMMDGALDAFRDVVRQASPARPRQAMLSCLHGGPMPPDDATDPDYWARQLRHTVRFSAGLQTLLDAPDTVLLECGPGQNLTAAVRQHRRDGRPAVCIPAQAHAQADTPADLALLEAVGALWQRGVEPDWPALFGVGDGPAPQRVHLPTYPFQRKRYWAEAPAPAAADASPALVQDTVAAAVAEPAQDDADDTPPGTRKERIEQTLVALFLDISGTEIQPGDYQTSFPEMGMDSLLLTQVAADVSSRFGLTLRFRQLLEDLSSIDALAAHLDAVLPDDAAAAQPGTGDAPEPMPADAPPGPADSGGARGPRVQATVPDGTQGRALAQHMASGRFGPYRAISKTRDGGLTETQQAYLDQLIQRLVARTRGSKAHAERARKHLADPRAIANFRLIWKEAVYQILCVRSDGSRIWDVDGNAYIDITSCFGAGFFGHRPEFVNAALRKQIDLGYEVGPQTPQAAEAAEKLCRVVRQERATFCNTGSEAVTGALRCARTVTGRDKVVYFTGDYHGIFDEVLGRANVVGGQLTTRPAAPGIIQSAVDNAMILDYGSDASLQVLREQGDQIAAVMVEPVQSLYPEIQPRAFLHKVREVTRETGSAFIVDEVITGFRVAPGGICEAWELDADICTYGKILGGEVPIGAVAGKARWIDAIDGGAWSYGDDSLPEAAATFFAGTFVRHPFAMAAANAVLDRIIADGGQMQRAATAMCEAFAADMNAFFEAEAVPLRIRHFSSWFRIDFPQDMPYVNLLWFHMLVEGIYVRESAQKFFFSVAHTQDDVQRIARVIKDGVRDLKAAGLVTTVTGAPVVDAPATDEAAGTAPAPADAVTGQQGALAVGASVPLTDAQREIWLALQVYPEAATAFNEVSYVDLRGSVDQHALLSALETVYQRHEALHLRLDAEGETLTRVDSGPVPVEVSDLGTGDAAHAAADAVNVQLRDHVFDLHQGPLARFHVMRLGDDHTRLAMAFHHMICDGWSTGLFVEEVGLVYSAAVEERNPALEPAVPFSGYARQLAGRGTAARKALEYWKRQFAEPPDPLRLPADRVRTDAGHMRGDTVHDSFSSEALQAVRSAAAKHKTTPYNWLLASYAVLMARLSGQYDVVIGIPVAGQALESQNALFGHCVQFLPIRVRMTPQQPFADTLAQVRQTLSDAYANADCTYGAMVAALDLPRGDGAPPLAAATFNVDPDSSFIHYAGADSQWHTVEKGSVVFDLFLDLTMGRDTLRGGCDFNADSFDRATVQRWLRAYEALLAATSASPDLPVGALPLGSAADRQAVLDDFNPPPLDHDRSTDVAALFRRQAGTTPDATAVAHADDTWTYAALDAASDAVAGDLAARGVQPGDLVAVCLPRTPALIAAMLGVLKAGAGYVPLDPRDPEARLRWMCEDSGAGHVIAQAGMADFGIPAVDIQAALDSTHAAPSITSDPARPAYVIYTSGSTGQPKGVLVRQRNLLALLAWAHDVYSPQDYAGTLVSASVCFDASVAQIFPPLTCGGSLVLVDDALALLRPLPAPVTMIDLVPSTLAEVMRHAALPHTARVVCTGGEALTTALADRVHAAVEGIRVIDSYGPTEATVSATFAERAPGDAPNIGHPQAGWRVYILDDGLQPVPVGVTGEIVIGGEGVAGGYLNRPDKTAQHFIADPFAGGDARMYRTGDLGRWRADGSIVYQGRADTQVKLRGYRIELGEVEAALADLPQVSQAVVDVREAAPDDQQLVAWWQAATDDTVRPADLRRALRDRLPAHMVPQQWVRVSQWPSLPSGKIDRRQLPEPFEQSRRAPGTDASASPAMQTLTDIWAEIIGDFEAQPSANFLDVGGHSLLAVRAAQAVRQQCGVDIPVRNMMLDSMGTLAMRIEAGSAPPDGGAPAPTDSNLPDKPAKKRSLAQRLGLKR